MKKLLCILLLMVALACHGAGHDIVVPKHEMRATWICTVWNLDWPSRAATGKNAAAEQRAELIGILDNCKAAGLNAVYFQVRPMADALYRSKLEPWSSFLTGSRGTAPADGWDPLAVCVEESHKRGMECHAWINPFRFSTSSTLPSTPADMKARDNGWIITYRNPKSKSPVSILDPGNPAARRHIVDVCRDIVTSYDVDGIIFDDYFYPEGLPLGGGYDYDEWVRSDTPDQAQWRRDNVNKAIREVHTMLSKVRPYVRFGISPAGVGGGNGKAVDEYGLPQCYAGNDWMYNGIFCDPVAWLAEGLIDYVSPQVYWATDHKTNPYEPIARWWSEVAGHFGRHSYVSHTFSDLKQDPEGAKDLWPEKLLQMRVDRHCAPQDAPGTVLYPSSPLKKSDNLSRWIADNHFTALSLPPAMVWKEAEDPGDIMGLELGDDGTLTWDALDGMRYVVYAIPLDADLSTIDLPGDGYNNIYMLGMTYVNRYVIPEEKREGYWIAVAPLDRYGNEWKAMILWQ